MMASAGLLSLKWNNHKPTFFHVLSTIRSKEAYCDVTIACDGRFYPVHKLVMSTCSDYFKEMFERTNCKHPVIVLKDIRHEDIEALLNYMYVGEVNVLQNELAGLIKAAECLMIKGLAVPDESPTKESSKDTKRGETKEGSPQAKKRRYDDSDNSRYDGSKSNISDRASSQNQSQRESSSSSSQQSQSARHSSSASGQSPSSRRQLASSNHTSEGPPDDHRSSQISRKNDNFQTKPEDSRRQDTLSNLSQQTETVVVLEEPSQVKEEPEEIQEIEEMLEDTKHVLESSFSYEHLSEGDSMSNVGDGSNQDTQLFDSQVMSGAPQSMEDLVAQAIPGSSGMEMGSSLWEEGNLQGLPPEAFGDSQGPQMVRQRVLMCPFCSRSTFKWASDLQRHIRIHTGEKPFHCHICKYSATQKSSLEYHLRTHTGEKPFHCHICNYSASRKSSLEYHIRTHTGEKPFACTQCPYRSAQKGGLDNHLLTNHVNKQ